MSFTSQRLLNKFPEWAIMRYDPSSQGARFFNPFGKLVEEEEFDYLRVSKLNEVILSGNSLYELDKFYYIDLNFLVSHEGLLINEPNFIFPQNYQFFLNENDDEPFRGGSSGAYTPYDFKTDFYNVKLLNSYNIPVVKIWDISFRSEDGLWFQVDDFINPDVNIAYRLMISIKDSTHYKRFNDEPDSVVKYGGHHKVVLRGIGEDGERITEHIKVKDDGVYYTKNRFLQLCGDKRRNKPAVERDGFNGNISIYLEGISAEEKICPFKLAVNIDGSNGFYHYQGGQRKIFWPRMDIVQAEAYKSVPRATGYEGPLLTSLSKDEDDDNLSFIDYYFHIFSNGQSYRRNRIDIEEEEDMRELLASQLLLKTSGESYNAVDFTFNWSDGKVWILDNDGVVHVHDIEPKAFQEWTFPRTKTIDIDLQPMTRRVVYGETIPCYTWHKILRRPIQQVTIYRESPEQMAQSKDLASRGVMNEPKFRGEYLHYDAETKEYSWDKTPYHFTSANKFADTPEASWKDIRFDLEFPIEKDEEGDYIGLGQWNFYCETILKGDKKLSLIALEKQLESGLITQDDYFAIKEEYLKNDDIDILQRSCTSVMVEHSEELVSIGSTESPLVENPIGLWIDGVEAMMRGEWMNAIETLSLAASKKDGWDF